jgi:hypothetical protein
MAETLGIHVKADCDLGDTTRSWRKSGELKVPKKVVVLGSGSLSFQFQNCVKKKKCRGFSELAGY